MFHGLKTSLVSSTPEVVLQRLRARRRADLFRATGVVFIHVPRTAGTSVTSALYGRFIGHFGLADLMAVSSADVLALPRFTIVRNPWERLVSAWSFARAGGGMGEHGAVQVQHPEQYAIAAFTSFESFVEDWLAARRPDELDGIFRPQHAYLLDGEERAEFTHMGRLEDIATTENWVSEVMGRNVCFTRQNASLHQSYRDYYTPRLRDRVAAIYARDIALLGYDF
jgi:hypothetical protein